MIFGLLHKENATMSRSIRSAMFKFYEDLLKLKKSSYSSGSSENVSEKLVFFVNGNKIEDDAVDPEWTLIYYLKNKLRLHGTKAGCDEGGCGTCTVMLSRYDRENLKEIHFPANACLVPICSLHGLAVTTVEGIGSNRTKLHPVQERIAMAHGSPCGFCTPGMVMSMYTLLRQNPKPTMDMIGKALVGNLCRCTGYRSIIDGFRTFTEQGNAISNQENKPRLFALENFAHYDGTQEPSMPLELKVTDKYDSEFLKITGPRTVWLRPTALDQILTIKHKNPEAQIVAGNSIGVFECRITKVCSTMVHSKAVPEMTEICETMDGVRVGASAAIEVILKFLRKMGKKHPEEKTRLFRAIDDTCDWMCTKQVKSNASMGGNITGASVSDLAPILIAGRAKLEINHKKNGSRLVPLDPSFFVGRSKTILKDGEVLVAIYIPFSSKNQYFKAYKHAKKRDVDPSIAHLAVKVEFEENSNIVSSIFFGIGGLGPVPLEAPKTQEKLKGLPWTKCILKQAYPSLLEDVHLDPETAGGMIRYRQALLLSLFFKIFVTIANQLQRDIGNKIDEILENGELSAIGKFQVKDYKSSQNFNTITGVHRPIVHTSAMKQATGEAVYLDDMPRYENELSMAFVFSTSAHANIVSIDASKALEIKGVHAFFSEDDISPEINQTGRYSLNEQIFHSKKVTSTGQIIGAILAVDQPLAQRAASLVKVEYKPIKPLIVTLDDAIKYNSFFHGSTMEICHGNVEETLKRVPCFIKGSCRTGNQKHFYFEPQSYLAVPQEEDGMEIYSSTQSPTDLVNVAADLLGVYQNKIKVHVKHLGGAFGGKEWKSIVIAQPAILAAKKFRRPIRCVLERRKDILMSGGRIPFLFNYTVGFNKQGKLLACDFDIYVNCGYSLAINPIVLRTTLNHLDSTFGIPEMKARCQLCKTNIPANAAMRGFGAAECQLPINCVVEEIAEYIHKDVTKIAEINLYNEGDKTFYGQTIKGCTIRRCWEECVKKSMYWDKRGRIREFNCENRYRKRGLSIVPAKFGIRIDDLPKSFLQATALVNVYTDGSVLLSHGGIEVGQGLNTKIIQVAAKVLEIPAEKIHIGDTATNIVPNCGPTVASIGLHCYGPAVIDACEQIKERLRPYKEENPTGTWKELVLKAYHDKVSLTAAGFFKHELENCNAETETETGSQFGHIVYGVACSEVEVDVLTGDHQVLRSDILLDVGESLNPAIDIGLMEGGFIQGYGFFVMEETLYSPSGQLITNGLARYKLPGVRNIPLEFNVSLLKGPSNPRAAYSSKVVGEPSIFLASSIYFAIKDAIKAARKEKGLCTIFHLDSPATVDKIRMACEDEITAIVPDDDKTT